jgi:hypothetical protein
MPPGLAYKMHVDRVVVTGHTPVPDRSCDRGNGIREPHFTSKLDGSTTMSEWTMGGRGVNGAGEIGHGSARK